MPVGDKYANLKQFLLGCKAPFVKLTYDDIEKILGFSLPESAKKFPEEWWNNTHSSQGTAWLSARYSTDFVTETFDGETIIFRKD